MKDLGIKNLVKWMFKKKHKNIKKIYVAALEEEESIEENANPSEEPRATQEVDENQQIELDPQKKICIFLSEDALSQAKGLFQNVRMFLIESNLLENSNSLDRKEALKKTRQDPYGVEFNQDNVTINISKNGIESLSKFKALNEKQKDAYMIVITDYEMSDVTIPENATDKEIEELKEKIESENGIALIKNVHEFHSSNMDSNNSLYSMILTANNFDDFNRELENGEKMEIATQNEKRNGNLTFINKEGIEKTSCCLGSKTPKPREAIVEFLNDVLVHKLNLTNASVRVSAISSKSVSASVASTTRLVPTQEETHNL